RYAGKKLKLVPIVHCSMSTPTLGCTRNGWRGLRLVVAADYPGATDAMQPSSGGNLLMNVPASSPSTQNGTRRNGNGFMSTYARLMVTRTGTMTTRLALVWAIEWVAATPTRKTAV